MRKLILVFVGCAMAFCLWPNQAPASNYHHISETSFSLMLHFSCIDYEEDTQSGRVLSGYKHQKQYFSQLWYFDYNPSLGKWQADFIQPKG